MSPGAAAKYKIKLASGRVLGPLDLNRVALFIKKGQITGVETVREHPVGDWKDINAIPEIASLLLQRAQGHLKESGSRGVPPALPSTRVQTAPGQLFSKNLDLTVKINPNPTKTVGAPKSKTLSRHTNRQTSPIEDDKTVLDVSSTEKERSVRTTEAESTVVYSRPAEVREKTAAKTIGSPQEKSYTETSAISEQQTVMLSRPAGKGSWGFKDAIRDPRKFGGAVENSTKSARKSIVGVLSTLSVVAIVYFLLDLGGPNSNLPEVHWIPVRATMPALDEKPKDPAKSTALYKDAMKYYVMDTVPGYKRAAALLSAAAQADSTNTKALALLASSYLNLIDSSNKDESYFSVISKLIELSRVRNNELPETVIADVEFYIVVNKLEAAQNRIVDYTKRQSKFGQELFYYLALTFLARGDAPSAARYISEYSEANAFSPKVFYLRGQIAEKLGDSVAALQEFQKAIKKSPTHAKSRLEVANILNGQDQLQNASNQLEYLIKHTALLAPNDLARAYYLHAHLSELSKNTVVAVADLRRATRLDPDNHDYLLELYTQLTKAEGGAKNNSLPTARMYYFLGAGEKFLKDGKYQDALTQFLQARQAFDKSPLPLVKIGDMFLRMNDLGNARTNYKMAAQRAPDNIQVWSKYIGVLIQSYEWQEAMAAMDKFRQLPVPQSAIDKAAADMYAKQGGFQQARNLYQKAMSRDVIDRDVYLAYAKVLVELKDYREAPFFFALALRFDPLNFEALDGIAKCIAATESPESAISMLRDELKKGDFSKAAILSAIAEFQIQKGSWADADKTLNDAEVADPDYPYTYKLKAKIYLNRDNEKGAIDKALDEYNAYSNRNVSDPSGYLERYRIFVKKSEFEKADDELRKIYGIYPKYPNLHFYKGALYSIMGNAPKAREEFDIELKNNPGSLPALMAQGKEYIKAGDANGAIPFLNKAMQLAPRSADPKIELAYANYLAKNFDGAVALYNAALQIDPGNPILYKRLGLVLRDKGDNQGAAHAFRKYLEMEPDASDKAEFLQYLR